MLQLRPCPSRSLPLCCILLKSRARASLILISNGLCCYGSCRQQSGKSHYEVLGVGRDASQAEIKQAFYSKCKQLHPDSDPSSSASTSAFVELKTAYDTLKRPADRRIYDRRYEMGSSYEGGNGMFSRDFNRQRHGFYAGSRDGRGFWNAAEGGRERKMSEADLFKLRDKQFRSLMKWTMVGAVLVVIYNLGYIMQLRYREYQLAQLIDSDEIAKSFLRQPELRHLLNDDGEVSSWGQLLKKDVDEAYRRRNEELRETRSPDEIREEYRWMKAVEDAGQYARYREMKRQRRERDRREGEERQSRVG